MRTRSQALDQSPGKIPFRSGCHVYTFLASLASMMRTIERTFSISIKSSTSRLIPKTSSKLPPRDKCPTESQPGTSSAVVSIVTDCGSTSKADLKASRTFVNTYSVSLISSPDTFVELRTSEHLLLLLPREGQVAANMRGRSDTQKNTSGTASL